MTPLARTALSILVTIVVLYGVVCFLAFIFQRRLVYFPGPPPGTTPAAAGLSFSEVWLTTEDRVTLHAWYVSVPDGDVARDVAGGGVVIVCHGNAGTIEHRLDTARAFVDMGLDVLLFDYRGYGASEGTPHEVGLHRDALAAYEYVVSERGTPSSRVVPYGESLGGAVALALAEAHPVGAVVVENTFTSLPDAGASAYPLLPVRWLLRERFDSLARIGGVGAPVLIVHSPDDDVIPFAHARRLHEAAADDAELLATGGRHDDGGFLRSPGARVAVARFIERALDAP